MVDSDTRDATTARVRRSPMCFNLSSSSSSSACHYNRLWRSRSPLRAQSGRVGGKFNIPLMVQVLHLGEEHSQAGASPRRERGRKEDRKGKNKRGEGQERKKADRSIDRAASISLAIDESARRIRISVDLTWYLFLSADWAAIECSKWGPRFVGYFWKSGNGKWESGFTFICEKTGRKAFGNYATIWW